MRDWRIWSSLIRWVGYVKGNLLAGVLAVFPAIGFIPAVQAGTPPSEYSCDELWHERNAIYAAVGYCFKTARARAEFGPGCFPPYGKLDKWQREMVAEIQSWEYRKGCR
jgi:YARHG domain